MEDPDRNLQPYNRFKNQLTRKDLIHGMRDVDIHDLLEYLSEEIDRINVRLSVLENPRLPQ